MQLRYGIVKALFYGVFLGVITGFIDMISMDWLTTRADKVMSAVAMDLIPYAALGCIIGLVVTLALNLCLWALARRSAGQIAACDRMKVGKYQETMRKNKAYAEYEYVGFFSVIVDFAISWFVILVVLSLTAAGYLTLSDRWDEVNAAISIEDTLDLVRIGLLCPILLAVLLLLYGSAKSRIRYRRYHNAEAMLALLQEEEGEREKINAYLADTFTGVKTDAGAAADAETETAADAKADAETAKAETNGKADAADAKAGAAAAAETGAKADAADAGETSAETKKPAAPANANEGENAETTADAAGGPAATEENAGGAGEKSADAAGNAGGSAEETTAAAGKTPAGGAGEMSDGMGEPPADDAQENDADGAREKPVDTKELLLYLRQYTGDPRREALAADVLQPYEQKIHDLFLDLLCGDVRADVESAVDGLALIRALTPEDKRYEQVLSMVEASFAFARDLRPYILSETYGQCDAAHCDKIMRLRIDEILEDTFAQPAWLNLWGLALRFPSEYAVFKALSDAWANFDRSPETPALDNALAELAITKKNDVVSEKFPAALDAAAGDERYFLHLASGLKWLNDTQDGAFLAEEKLLLETMNARGLLTAAHLRERLPQL